jgi:hypothetical protein
MPSISSVIGQGLSGFHWRRDDGIRRARSKGPGCRGPRRIRGRRRIPGWHRGSAAFSAGCRALRGEGGMNIQDILNALYGLDQKVGLGPQAAPPPMAPPSSPLAALLNLRSATPGSISDWMSQGQAGADYRQATGITRRISWRRGGPWVATIGTTRPAEHGHGTDANGSGWSSAE